MAKRKSTVEDLLDVLIELAALSWHAGVVISLVLAALALKSLLWAVEQHTIAINSSAGILTIFKSMPWIYYVFPSALGLVTFIFIYVTYKAYMKNNNPY